LTGILGCWSTNVSLDKDFRALARDAALIAPARIVTNARFLAPNKKSINPNIKHKLKIVKGLTLVLYVNAQKNTAVNG
jgi:hypothetical protein